MDQNSLLPEPKHFTPVVLIHYQDQYDVTKIPHMFHPGGGEFCSMHKVAATSSKAHYNSIMTKDIAKILTPFEKDEIPQLTLIEGAPGIGKSVLLREIAYRWANLQVLHKFKLLLLVSLRDPVIQNMSSFEDLCPYFCKYGMKGTDIVSACTKYFFRNGRKNLMFLLDGYDEFPKNLQQKNGNLIVDLLRRHELPECGIIISSRPHGLAHLRQQANTRVEILGFTEKEQEQFIRQEFKDQSQKISDLTTYLKQNLIISSMCIVPFNMMTLVYLYGITSTLPDNSTEMYNSFICFTICQNLRKHKIAFNHDITDFNKFPDPYGKIIKQLSEWSLLALHKNQLTFTFDEIKGISPEIETVPGAINGFGLLRAVEHVNVSKTLTFNFVHFSIQEFLAANYISHYLSYGELLSLLKEKFWDNFYSNMFMMYVALTKGQQLAFKEFLCEKSSSLKRSSDNKNQSVAIPSVAIANVAIAEKFLTDQLKALHLFRCFSEAKDAKMCNTIEKAFASKKIILGGNVLSPNDVQSVAVLLTKSSIKHWDKLDLFLSHIQHHGIRILHRALKDSNVTIREVIFTKNGLDCSSDILIRDIIIGCRVQVLWISYNDSVGETKDFSSTLSDPACMLNTLYVRYNKLSSNAAISIFTELRKASCSQLRILEISYNNITDGACRVIAITMKNNKSLKRLEMYRNPISIQGVKVLLQALQSNMTLKCLGLPKYSDSITDEVKHLQSIVNDKRKECNCSVDLKIVYSQDVQNKSSCI